MGGGWEKRLDTTLGKNGFIQDARGWGRYLAIVLAGDSRDERVLLVGAYMAVKGSADYKWQQGKLTDLVSSHDAEHADPREQLLTDLDNLRAEVDADVVFYMGDFNLGWDRLSVKQGNAQQTYSPWEDWKHGKANIARKFCAHAAPETYRLGQRSDEKDFVICDNGTAPYASGFMAVTSDAAGGGKPMNSAHWPIALEIDSTAALGLDLPSVSQPRQAIDGSVVKATCLKTSLLLREAVDKQTQQHYLHRMEELQKRQSNGGDVTEIFDQLDSLLNEVIDMVRAEERRLPRRPKRRKEHADDPKVFKLERKQIMLKGLRSAVRSNSLQHTRKWMELLQQHFATDKDTTKLSRLYHQQALTLACVQEVVQASAEALAEEGKHARQAGGAERAERPTALAKNGLTLMAADTLVAGVFGRQKKGGGWPHWQWGKVQTAEWSASLQQWPRS